MSWSAVLDVAIGLSLVYLVFSVAASRVNEFVVTLLQWRAQGLERGLRSMLGGSQPPPTRLQRLGARLRSLLPKRDSPADRAAQGTSVPVGAGSGTSPTTTSMSADDVTSHAIVTAFDSAAGTGRRLSYLPARAFSAAVLDLLAPPAAGLADSILQDDGLALTDESRVALEALRVHPDSAHLAALEQALSVGQSLPPGKRVLTPQQLAQLRAAISDDVLDRARAAVGALPPDHPARRPLLRMLADAEDDRDAFRAKLEHWYDDTMDRLSGWYKRRVQRWIVVYSAVLAVLFNVDTVNMVDGLWRSPVEQTAAAQAAATAAGKDVGAIDTSLSALRGLAAPIGWSFSPAAAPAAPAAHSGSSPSPAASDPRRLPTGWGAWLLKVLGLALTILALSFGAPFWFDVLGKLARVRNTGPRPAPEGTPAN